MDLTCFVYPGWEPRIRAARPKRDWMDNAPEAFPYRCLPLSIANGHGWEILSPCGFEVEWNGGPAVDDVVVRPDAAAREAPVALFGLGTFTLHVQGLFRTTPGWNLYVGGPPNSAKDGATALSGIIETDWAPYTFTMNWRLTRPGQVVRFEDSEPIAHIFPVERKAIEAVVPRFAPIAGEPELKASFEAWSRSRDAFQARMREHPPEAPADKWQKFYYRGQTPDGHCPIGDHQTKLRIREFANADLVRPLPRDPAPLPDHGPPAEAGETSTSAAPANGEAAWKLAKYEWMLETQERQRALSTAASGIFRCKDLTTDEFLDNFYAPGRPTIVCGAIDAWPAFGRWTPEYLKARIGSAEIECQAGRDSNSRFELEKNAHKQKMPFDRFVDLIAARSGNDFYVTAYNSAANATAFAALRPDIGSIEAILNPDDSGAAGMIWVGPGGTFTPLHHDLTNNLLVQVTGRKRVTLVSPAETSKLHNDVHVFSALSDLNDPKIDLAAFPKARDIRKLDFILEAGEALFIPIGWWHQVSALDFSVSITFTNFRWPNDGFRDHPTRAA